jgi:predicted  nucleic acid-binding Zn-ribbon protein
LTLPPTPSPRPSGERAGGIPKDSERAQETLAADSEAGTGRIRELEKEVMDLKITSRGKDYLIEQLQKERSGFSDQLLASNRKVGELETKLMRLESPKTDTTDTNG